MADSSSAAGIALLCDREGRIREVVRDQLGLAGRFAAGALFSSGLDAGSVGKGLRFLQELRECGVTFEWEIQVAAENEPVRTLCFQGCVLEGGLLILGAASSRDLLGYLDELGGVNNEQVNLARSALKELAVRKVSMDRQHDLYNDLTRLNNEIANSQRELVKQNVELERLNRLKTQFLGMAAHDLRSPTGTILSYCDFLLEEAAAVLNEEQLEFLNIIRGTSESMLLLINDFLDVSAIESGHLNLNRRPVDLRQFLEHHVGLSKLLGHKKSIQVILQIDGVLPAFTLDQGKIAQVLNNLLSNAMKFSQPGTTVHLRATAVSEGVQIEVRDQGPGIPESERGKLFQPFGKTSVRATAGESSTGLGLAIARKIVEGHGGRIWAESQVGAGSTFGFTLRA